MRIFIDIIKDTCRHTRKWTPNRNSRFIQTVGPEGSLQLAKVCSQILLLFFLLRSRHFPLLSESIGVVATLFSSCFSEWPLLRCLDMGCADCFYLLPIFDGLSASHSLQHHSEKGSTGGSQTFCCEAGTAPVLCCWRSAPLLVTVDSSGWTGSQSRTMCWYGVSLPDSGSGLLRVRHRLQLCNLLTAAL